MPSYFSIFRGSSVAFANAKSKGKGVHALVHSVYYMDSGSEQFYSDVKQSRPRQFY